MRKSREEAAQTRKRIVKAASEEFRKNGIVATGLNDLMSAAGLTHGGFYKHFSSRDDLMRQAAALALVDGETKMARAARRNREEPRTGLIDSYLSARHRDAPGTGCAVVSLGAAAGRGEAEMKEAYEKQVRSYLELISGTADGDDSDEARADAMLTLSAMVGALLMSRAVADPELSDQLLRTVAARLKGEPVQS